VPSRIDATLRAALFAALLAGMPAVRPATADQHIPPASAESLTPGEISHAIETVESDPNIAPTRTTKTLRWKDSGAKPSRVPGFLRWIAGLFEKLTQSARLLMWGAAILLAGSLLVYLVRTVRPLQLVQRDEPLVVPTHVRDLDIRPETLPADIGAAARGLWDAGEHRASLAILYRGLLSRLAHVHRLAIRDSSTEGDCLAMSVRSLPVPRSEYVARLVGAWQRFVYGREEVAAASVYALCDDFAAALDRPEAQPAPAEGVA
jgi:Domain of unknown function (DUF4129)